MQVSSKMVLLTWIDKNHLAKFIKTKINESKNKAMRYHILVFTVLKEQKMATLQNIRKGPKCCCFTFLKGQLSQLFIIRIKPTCIIDTLIILNYAIWI